MIGSRDLQGKDDDFPAMAVLHAEVAVRLETRERRERDLLLPRVLSPPTYNHIGMCLHTHPTRYKIMTRWLSGGKGLERGKGGRLERTERSR